MRTTRVSVDVEVRPGSPGEPAEEPPAVDSFAAGGTASVDAAGASTAPEKPPLTLDLAAIFDEMKTADFSGLGIDPKRYVEDRFDAARFLGPLTADPARTVTIHAGAARISEVPSFVSTPGCNVTHDDPKDFPARVYRDPAGDFHVVGLVGETWTQQAAYMLAAAGVDVGQVKLEGQLDGAGRAAAELDPTLQQHKFATVTLGPVGAMTGAVDRSLRAAVLPAHQRRVVADIEAFLDDRAAHARDDKRPRWTARRDRFAQLAQQHTHAEALLEAAGADPVLRGPLGAFLARAADGPPDEDLPRTLKWSGKIFRHAVLSFAGEDHLLISVAHAHGDLAEDAIARVLALQPHVDGMGFYGTCGSFSDQLGPDTLISPRGVANTLDLAGAVDAQHAGVDTLLQEHRAGIDALLKSGAETVDIEVHHVARARRLGRGAARGAARVRRGDVRAAGRAPFEPLGHQRLRRARADGGPDRARLRPHPRGGRLMTRAPLEVDPLRSLERLAEGEARHVLVDDAGDDELAALLVEEARGYHAVELDVLRRKLASLEVIERDRAGHAEAVPDARAARARAAIADHEAARERADDARARAVLARFERAPRDRADALEDDGAVVVELHRDGYGRTRDLDARRELLGLEGDADW
jgi:hypothetical protein